MTQNSTSRTCWAYETTPNVAGISGATDTSYYFGRTDDSEEKWTPPSPELNVQAFYNYAQRMPVGLSKLDPKYPDFSISYNPTTAQFLGRFYGLNTEGTPCTHAPVASGLQLPITCRLEQLGGTQERVSQAVGCQTVGIDLLGRLDGKLRCDETLAWGFYEDEVDRDVLTTEPKQAGNLTSDSYEGRPCFTWNGYQMNEVISARFSQKQGYEKSYDASTGKRQVYKYSYQPPQVILEAIFNNASGYDIFDDWIDRTKRNCTLRFTKSDNTNYVQIGLSGCQVINIKETGIRHKGHYVATITIIGETASGTSNFLNEGSGFATHFKGVA